MALSKSFFSLILVALIAFKVCTAAIHIHLHHDHEDEHEEHCELCELALEFITTEFSTAGENQIVEIVLDTNFDLSKASYNSVCVVANTDSTLFGRPPPSSI